MERSMSRDGDSAEETPTNSEQELHLLVEAIPAAVWRAGPEGNIEYVNKRVLEYLGKPLGEIIGWGWMESVHPDDVAFKVRSKIWSTCLRTGEADEFSQRVRNAQGCYRWFLSR